MDNHPGLFIKGTDISKELLRIAAGKNKIPRENLIRSDAYSLPFKDNSFDAVVELGVLHHVKNPSQVVTEMIRISKKVVFISDANRFGQGSYVQRIIKFILYKLKLWNLANYIKTRGRGYTVSEGDGIAYSYSVFDSYPILMKNSRKIIAIPTAGKEKSSVFTLFSSPHFLICAFKS